MRPPPPWHIRSCFPSHPRRRSRTPPRPPSRHSPNATSRPSRSRIRRTASANPTLTRACPSSGSRTTTIRPRPRGMRCSIRTGVSIRRIRSYTPHGTMPTSCRARRRRRDIVVGGNDIPNRRAVDVDDDGAIRRRPRRRRRGGEGGGEGRGALMTKMAGRASRCVRSGDGTCNDDDVFDDDGTTAWWYCHQCCHSGRRGRGGGTGGGGGSWNRRRYAMGASATRARRGEEGGRMFELIGDRRPAVLLD